VNQFRLLTPQDYDKYAIRPPSGFTGQIAWYAYPTTYYDDGPWLVLVLLRPTNHPEVLTLHVCRYDEEYIMAYDEEHFDVLQHTNGSCSFTQERLEEFVGILRKHSEQLSDVPRQGFTFQHIAETDFPKWHIRDLGVPPWLKYLETFYYQVYDPLEASGSRDSATLIRFSRSWGEELFFGLYSFPRSALQDPAYVSTDHGIGRINLDRKGIDEFIHLLERHWHSLR